MDSSHVADTAATPPVPAATTTATSPASPPPAPTQQSDALPQLFPPWPGSIQAMYAGAAATSAGAQLFYPGPFPWGTAGGDRNRNPPHPYMLAPYGSSMAYPPPPLYPSGAAYTHPSTLGMGWDFQGSVYIAAEAERRMLEASRSLKGGSMILKPPSHKVASGSHENASHSICKSEESYETKEESTYPQRKNFRGTFGDEGNTDHLASTQHTSSSESSPDVKRPVFELERTVSRNPAIDLNMEMDSLNPSRMNLKDDRELRREKRKQANRDSARRSRLRKLQECEELARRVDELNEETSGLRNELDEINKDCEELEIENNSIEEELVGWFGAEVLSGAPASSIDSHLLC